MHHSPEKLPLCLRPNKVIKVSFAAILVKGRLTAIADNTTVCVNRTEMCYLITSWAQCMQVFLLQVVIQGPRPLPCFWHHHHHRWGVGGGRDKNERLLWVICRDQWPGHGVVPLPTFHLPEVTASGWEV